MRSLLAVLVGYLVFGISAVALFQLAHVDPHQVPGVGFMIGSTLYGVFFAIAAGYTAARMGRHKEMLHSGAVAGIIALLALVSILAQPGLPSYWSQITAIVFIAPTALVGGWLRARQTREQKSSP